MCRIERAALFLGLTIGAVLLGVGVAVIVDRIRNRETGEEPTPTESA